MYKTDLVFILVPFFNGMINNKHPQVMGSFKI